MKQVVIIIVAMSMMAGCAKKAINSGGAVLRITYVQDTHRTWNATCPGDCLSRGHGTVKNVGDADAYNIHVRVETECETFMVPVIPDALAPGQIGSYRTGNYCGASNPMVSTEYSGAP